LKYDALEENLEFIFAHSTPSMAVGWVSSSNPSQPTTIISHLEGEDGKSFTLSGSVFRFS